MTTSSVSAERFVWRSGKPVFDILRSLFSASDDATNPSLDEKIKTSGIGTLLREKETLEENTETLLKKIQEWHGHRSEIKEKIKTTRQSFVLSIAEGTDPDQIDKDLKSLMSEDTRLSEWILTAEKIVFDTKKQIDSIQTKIGRALNPIVLECRDDVQKKIDRLSSEICRLYSEHFNRVRDLAKGVRVTQNSSGWTHLVATIPQQMFKPAWIPKR